MIAVRFMLGVSAALLAAMPALAQAPSWAPPAESARCPSKWGASDERGAANHIKPQTVLNALKLIKTGEIIELGQPLAPNMPLVGTRRFDMHTKRTVMNPQSNERGSNEELVVAEIGQVGTQLDGFTHQTHRDSLTVADIEDALKKQNLALQPGDAIIIHTGRGKLWGKDNARYSKSAPGLGVKSAEWLISKDPVLLGSDTYPVEVFPNPDPAISGPVHQIALVVNGVYLLENLKLDELAAKNVGEFAFIMTPLKIQGGTGSTVSPVALR